MKRRYGIERLKNKCKKIYGMMISKGIVLVLTRGVWLHVACKCKTIVGGNSSLDVVWGDRACKK